jgi:hypothetical protein
MKTQIGGLLTVAELVIFWKHRVRGMDGCEGNFFQTYKLF